MAKSAALAGFSAALLSAGSANAAMEVASIAAGDNRFGTIALLAVPVLGVRLGQLPFARTVAHYTWLAAARARCLPVQHFSPTLTFPHCPCCRSGWASTS